MRLNQEKKLKFRRSLETFNQKPRTKVYNFATTLIKRLKFQVSYFKSSIILRAIFLRFLIFILIFIWIFSGWPRIWEKPAIPPEIQEVRAVYVMPTYQAKGTFTSGNGALTVPVPAGYQDNDVFLLFVESENEVIATPTNWTQLTNSPQGTGTAKAAGAVRLAVFYKVVSGTQSSVSVADSGDHTAAIIANFRGVDTSSPIHVTAGAVDAGTTASLSCPNITTTIDNALIVNAIGLDKDAVDADTLSNWQNTNLSDLTEQQDQTINTGDGGGIAFATGGKASAGTVGNTTATGDTATTHAYLTIALTPVFNNPPTLSISQPDGVGDTVTVGDAYNITYSLADTDNVVTAAFYYDTNNSGLDGTAITGACATAAEGTNVTCSWNTTGVTPGSYYVYGITNDGVNPQVSAYSSGQITINAAGALTVDIVDAGGTSVPSPSMAMGAVTFSFSYQTANGTFGVSTQKIRVNNTTASPAWTLTIAASGGPDSLWSAGTPKYDFNDPTANAEDGSDSPDTVGGQMTINPLAGTITPQGGCSNTDVNLQSSNSFSEDVTNNITLIIAGSSAQTNCYWDLTGVSISQTIPASQSIDTYTLDLTLTVI